jgi:hypothetical protein
MKVYTLRVGRACGECESVSCGRKWLLGGNPSCFTVQLTIFPAEPKNPLHDGF